MHNSLTRSNAVCLTELENSCGLENSVTCLLTRLPQNHVLEIASAKRWRVEDERMSQTRRKEDERREVRKGMLFVPKIGASTSSPLLSAPSVAETVAEAELRRRGKQKRIGKRQEMKDDERERINEVPPRKWKASFGEHVDRKSQPTDTHPLKVAISKHLGTQS